MSVDGKSSWENGDIVNLSKSCPVMFPLSVLSRLEAARRLTAFNRQHHISSHLALVSCSI